MLVCVATQCKQYNCDLKCSTKLKEISFSLFFSGVEQGIYYVYVLISKNNPKKTYVGFTNSISRRIKEHNSISNIGYTSKYSPWILNTYICFSKKRKAKDFEKYLKKGSGFAFMKKRLL